MEIFIGGKREEQKAVSIEPDGSVAYYEYNTTPHPYSNLYRLSRHCHTK